VWGGGSSCFGFLGGVCCFLLSDSPLSFFWGGGLVSAGAVGCAVVGGGGGMVGMGRRELRKGGGFGRAGARGRQGWPGRDACGLIAQASNAEGAAANQSKRATGDRSGC